MTQSSAGQPARHEPLDRAEDANAIVARLRTRIRATVDPLVRGHTECALIGFPDSSNVGDNAIWLGQVAWLRDAGIRIAYRCHARSYRPKVLDERTRAGVILLSGGGNLGDVWPRLERLREKVIADFPGRRIVQLPQSICFRERDALARARAVVDRHPALTLLVRDAASLAFARSELQARTLLCPDMAFYLGTLPPPPAPDTDVLWLRRTDVEAVRDADPVGNGSTVAVDWLDSRLPALTRFRDALQPLVGRHPRRLSVLRRVAEATFDVQARQRLAFGCGLLARGRVVITDRLHGHILSVLLGIPHVLLDNNNGKLRNFHKTWTASMPGVRWAGSPAEAQAAAEELLAQS